MTSSESAFERLHAKVRKWIWDQDWKELRDVQAQSISAILDGEHDVLIAAATAGGKTEAAFLPLASLLAEREAAGIRILCVSPLKALINDQFARLTDIFSYLNVPVHRWHGDVDGNRKRKLLDTPDGVLLITPESLEALFVIHGYRIATILAGVERVVIDEAHVFIASDRGKQLQSLLARLEQRVGRQVPRIGLSATLGDMAVAAEYLRPGRADQVLSVVSNNDSQEIQLQLRGYEASADQASSVSGGQSQVVEPPNAGPAIAEHIWRTLRGNNHLVFSNRRARVEKISELLRRRSEKERVPNEFVPHHGNLSRDLREEAERRLKDTTMPTTAICTSTLELGIDIGQVESVGQIDAPFSVASIRQRLGRSGRRGGPSILRMYIEEASVSSSIALVDELRSELVQAIAMVELLIERWCEPNDPGGLNLSTLVQQILSLIAERGGVTALTAWKVLCDDGAFRSVDQAQFVALLRSLGTRDLVTQAPDQTLLLGEKGENIVNHYTFFAVFSTPDEYRLLHAGRPLGTLSVDTSLVPDILLVFAGRCWRVISVDAEAKIVVVEPAPGGRLPHFEGGQGGLVHDVVRQRMRDIWCAGDVPRYLDATARKLLTEARACHTRLGLDDSPIRADGSDTVLFLCRGDRIANTVSVMLASRGHAVMQKGPLLMVKDRGVRAVVHELSSLLNESHDPVELARRVENKRTAKYDWALSNELSSQDYASRALDIPGALSALSTLLDD